MCLCSVCSRQTSQAILVNSDGEDYVRFVHYSSISMLFVTVHPLSHTSSQPHPRVPTHAEEKTKSLALSLPLSAQFLTAPHLAAAPALALLAAPPLLWPYPTAAAEAVPLAAYSSVFPSAAPPPTALFLLLLLDAALEWWLWWPLLLTPPVSSVLCCRPPRALPAAVDSSYVRAN